MMLVDLIGIWLLASRAASGHKHKKITDNDVNGRKGGNFSMFRGYNSLLE